MKITGTTRLYAIIGDPIAQVRSPEVFSERFANAGGDAVLVPAHVPRDRFDSIVPALLDVANLDGVLVTLPFKARMVPFAHRLGKTAQVVGAVNALRREADGSWTADMFDGVGFVRGAERKGKRVKGRRVALFGAGGAGSAIACALTEAGIASIDVIDVDAAKAKGLVGKLTEHFPHCRSRVAESVPKGIDLLLNASTVGMRPDDGLPGRIETLERSTLVGDVVIRETPTALVRLAMERGCDWVDGRDMHAGQVDALVAFFAAASAPDLAIRAPTHRT